MPDAVPTPLRVSLLAIPEGSISTLTGIFDVMNAFRIMPGPGGGPPLPPPFAVEIAGLRSGPLELVSGVPVTVQRAVADIPATDIVIVPSVVLGPEGWEYAAVGRGFTGTFNDVLAHFS